MPVGRRTTEHRRAVRPLWSADQHRCGPVAVPGNWHRGNRQPVFKRITAVHCTRRQIESAPGTLASKQDRRRHPRLIHSLSLSSHFTRYSYLIRPSNGCLVIVLTGRIAPSCKIWCSISNLLSLVQTELLQRKVESVLGVVCFRGNYSEHTSTLIRNVRSGRSSFGSRRAVVFPFWNFVLLLVFIRSSSTHFPFCLVWWCAGCIFVKINKKLSYCLEIARLESLPKMAEIRCIA